MQNYLIISSKKPGLESSFINKQYLQPVGQSQETHSVNFKHCSNPQNFVLNSR